MEPISFDTIAAAWTRIRNSGAPNLKSIVSGLVDPSRILIQRVGESPTTLTIMFKGFDQALENTDRDGPIMNRALFAWVRKFAEAQIVRGGDSNSFTVLIRKPPQTPTQPPVQAAPMPESKGALARISNVRKVNA